MTIIAGAAFVTLVGIVPAGAPLLTRVVAAVCLVACVAYAVLTYLQRD